LRLPFPPRSGICVSIYFEACGVLVQLLVGAGGLWIMTAVAYYRSWSKRVEKPVHADFHRSTAEEALVPIGELVQQSTRVIASAI